MSMLVAIVSGWKFWRSANRKTGNPGLYLFSNQTPNWLQDPYLTECHKILPQRHPGLSRSNSHNHSVSDLLDRQAGVSGRQARP